MGLIRLIAAPICHIANSRLFQLGAVVAIVLLLENFSNNHAVLAKTAHGLDKLVEWTVQLISDHFHNLRTLTKSMVTDGVMIGYVYLVCLVGFALLRRLMSMALDLAGRTNFLWLRRTIARDRGIAAYRAWLPLERIGRAGVRRQFGKRSSRGLRVVVRPIRLWPREWCAAR